MQLTKRVYKIGVETGLKHPEQYSYDFIKEKLARDCWDPQIRALFYMIYGYALRATEAAHIRKKDFIVDREGTILRISAPSLKKRCGKSTKKNLVESGDGYYRTKEIINPRRYTKEIPISMIEEGWITEPILKYLDMLPNPEDRIFPKDRSTIYRACYRLFNFNPHGLRKIRLTHLVTKFHFTDRQLVQYAGWENALPAGAYVKLRYDDIIPTHGREPLDGNRDSERAKLLRQIETESANNVQH